MALPTGEPRRGMRSTLTLLALLGAAACRPAAARLDERGAVDCAAAGRATKRALLVAISDYERTTNWPSIHGENDVPLVKAALEAQGFASDDIHPLIGEKATGQGIRTAIEKWLLEPSCEGDVVVFGFFGHGQQITDDEHEEEDGYDEALVPWDAPMNPGPGYDGAKHLRDDDLDELMQRLRDRVGTADPDRRGNVVAILDSCFSGTARGDAPVRGGAPPIGPPAAGTAGRPRPTAAAAGGGFFTRGEAAAESPRLAPYVAITAARAEQPDQEIVDYTKKQFLGSLSWALARALSELRVEPTYRNLVDEVQSRMRDRLVANEPQLEGDGDARIFSGKAVRQAAYVTVESAAADGRSVVLALGALGNLLPGATVEIHRTGTLGTPKPTSATLLAVGKVVAPEDLTAATVELDRQVDRRELETGRAFVTRYAFGDLRLRVRVKDLGDEALRAAIAGALKEKVAPALLVDTDADVTVGLDPLPAPATPAMVSVVTASGTAVLDGVERGSPGLADTVANRILDLTRNLYLSRLRLSDPALDYRLEVVPVEFDNCSDPDAPTPTSCNVRETDRSRFVSVGGRLQLAVGTYYRLRVHPGRSAAYLSVLDLMPDGRINVYWPRKGQKPLYTSKTPFTLDRFFRVTEPTGTEKLLLIAIASTATYRDFSPLQSTPSLAERRSLTPREIDDLGPLAPLFADRESLAREVLTVQRGDIATTSVEYTVVREHSDAPIRATRTPAAPASSPSTATRSRTPSRSWASIAATARSRDPLSRRAPAREVRAADLSRPNEVAWKLLERALAEVARAG